MCWESPAFLGHKLGDGILSQGVVLVPTLCRLGELCQRSLKEGFTIKVNFTQDQFQQCDGIHQRTGYLIHFHISVILIFLLRTTLIVLGLFCMLYSDILIVLIVVLELERVLCKFASTFPSSPAQVITKVEPHKFLELGQSFEKYKFFLHISSFNSGFLCCGLGFPRL